MKILFVCLGNICRSPMAEGVMKDLVQQHQLDWYIDSAGTESYHIGQQPDGRAVKTCIKYGINIGDQRARKLSKKDFETFDLIYALADEVLHEIKSSHPNPPQGKLKLLLDEVFPGEHRSVPDPWYGGEEGFDPVFHMIREACEAVVKKYGSVSSAVI
ncbi:MAG: low molecular weight protein-tyrosine-phosphatase [Chitinophagales bacterium]